MSIQTHKPKLGFTLVELLMVIAILGVLAALGSYAVFKAIPTVREGVVKSEINQIATKLELYKQEYGDYPPDFSDENAVMRHIKKRWPNHKYADYAAVADAIKTSSGIHNSDYEWDVDDTAFKHAGALAFWLGGFPDDNDILAGFCADPQKPFTLTVDSGGDETSQRQPPMGEYTIGKNVDLEISGGKVPMVMFRDAPLVYFVSDSKGSYVCKSDSSTHVHGKHVELAFTNEDFGTAAPYAKKVDGTKITWHEPKKFQIIHPGSDGVFSSDVVDDDDIRSTDDEATLEIEDYDNIVSFGENPRLESLLD